MRSPAGEVFQWSYPVGDAQDLCNAFLDACMCSIVFVQGMVGEHHYLHE